MNNLVMDEIMQLSPYDDSFPTRFLQIAFDFQTEKAAVMTERIYHDVMKKTKMSMPVIGTSEEKMRLVVDASDELIQDYKDGAIKLAKIIKK